MRNSDENRVDDVEKLLAEAKLFEGRKQALIAELLKQKEAAGREFDEKKENALKAFDDKLAKLGHQANSSGRTRRSHHKRAAAQGGDAAAKPKAKT